MAKARLIAMTVLTAVILLAMAPVWVMAASPPGTPDKDYFSPAEGATDITLTPILHASPFSDNETTNSPHAASQWRIVLDEADAIPLFDSGVDFSNLESIDIPEGFLTYATTYYWQVRYQDELGWWSGWSTWTFFTTIGAGDVPSKPANVSPADGTVDIVLQPGLVSSNFATLNAVGTHAASQWQLTVAGADFASPLWDSNVSGGLTTITVPAGVLTYNLNYEWRVRHQDNYGNWSTWSDPTGFKTIANLPPGTPTNMEPVPGATEIILTPTLKSSAFKDPDPRDTHAASQWQLTATAGDYDAEGEALLYDSGIVTLKLTEITIPVGILEPSSTYYWHVRHQDSFGNWSAYSTETSFSTVTVSTPTAEFSGDTTGVAGSTVVFYDESLGATSWVWDMGDDTIVNWDPITRPRNGVLSHIYAQAGTYTVSLSVSNPAGTDNMTKVDFIVIAAVPKSAFLVLAGEAGTDSRFTDVSSGQITSWTWDFGDGTIVKWTEANRPANGQITHKYDRDGTFVASLTVEGPLGDHTVMKQVVVDPSTGLKFEWWMLGAAAALLIVIGGGIYLFRGISKRKEA